MTTRRPAPLLSILALGGASMLVAACGGGAGTAESSSAAAPATSAATSPTAEPSPSAEPLKVVAAFYPLQYAAEQVGGAAVEVTNLTPPGAEPHDLELTPQDVVAIGEADLVLYIPGFQPALDEAIAQEAADRSLDVTTELDDLLKGHDHDHSDEGHSDEGHSDEGHDHGDEGHSDEGHDHGDEGHSDEGHDHGDEGHSDEGHDHGDETGIDPHVWLNPINMGLIGGQIAERLAEIAPESNESFVSGSDALMSAMQLLDTEWALGTAECANRLLVVSHEAFGYLAAQYNFEQVGISGLSPDAEPSPAKVAEVIDIVKSDGVTTIYFETLVDPKIAEVVAAETGAQTATLDPLEGLTDGASGDYVSIMQANLASVQAGNGCA
jgi:zinc transport system substrate-binding protein